MSARLLLCITVGLSATSGHAGKAALLPLVAEGLLPSARDSLDQDVRAALAGLGVRVQSAAETAAHVEEGHAAGLDCALTKDDCALRVGLISDVDVVVTASVEVIDDRALFRGSWIEVVPDPTSGRSSRKMAGALVLPAVDGGASLRGLVRQLVLDEGPKAPVPVRIELDPPHASLLVDGRSAASGFSWLTPGKHHIHAETAERVPLERDLIVSSTGDDPPVLLALQPILPERSVSLLLASGIGVGVVGAVVGLAAGGTSVVIESQLNDILATDERQQLRDLGVAALVATSIGGALAITGGALALAGALE